MRNVIKILFCCLIFTAMAGWATGEMNSTKIIDPYKEEDFSCTGKPDGRLWNTQDEIQGYGRFRIRADLNFDGREDLILTRSEQNGGAGCGNQVCDVDIFLKQPDGSYLKENFELHPLAVNLKKVKQGKGNLSVYRRLNVEEGSITLYEVTSNSIKLKSSQTIHPGNSTSDEKLYESLFGENSRLKPEFAGCKNGELYWTDKLD